MKPQKSASLKNAFRIFACFVLLCSFSIGELSYCDFNKLPFPEKLYYDVYWKFIKVGYGTLELRGLADFNGRKAFSIYSESKSSAFFDGFFKVRDSNISWVDAEKSHSLAFEQHISEGKYKRDRRVDYNQEKHIAANNKGEVFDIPDNVLDVLAALYKVRASELAPGGVVTVSVNSAKKNYNMSIKVLKKETVKIDGTKFGAVVIEPDMQDAGIFINKGTLRIWLTDDANHIPVKMQSEITVGSITAELRQSQSVLP